MITNDNQRKGEMADYLKMMHEDDHCWAQNEKKMKDIVNDFQQLTKENQERQKELNTKKMGQMCKTDLEIINLELYEDKVWNLNDREQMQYRDEFINKTIAPGTYPLTLEQGKRPQSELQKDVLYNFNLLKRNLENIMSSPKDIELIANSINIDNRYNINKDWDSIKQKYINIYGVNNPHLTNKDIIKFLNENIGYMSNSAELLERISILQSNVDSMKTLEKSRKNAQIIRNLKDDLRDTKQKLENKNIKEDEIEILKNHIDKLEKNIQELKKQRNESIMREQILSKSLSDYDEYYRDIEQKIPIFKKYLEDYVNKINYYNKKTISDNEKDELKQKNNELKKIVNDLENDLINTETILKELFEKNEITKEEFNKMNSNLGFKINQYVKLQQDYDELNEKYNELLISNKKQMNEKDLFELKNFINTEIKREQMIDLYPQYKTKNKPDIINSLSNDDLIQLQKYINNYNENNIIKLKDTPLKKAEGISRKHKNIVKFGSIGIDKQKLYNDNILSIVDDKNRKIHFMKNKKVSDDFVELLCHNLEGNKVSQREINLLDKDDKNLYNVVLKMAKQHKGQGINIDDTENELKKKFELLEGEIMAGNNNKKLLDDMKELMGNMVRIKLISQNNAISYLKNIKEYF
jgi:hypothetical protein